MHSFEYILVMLGAVLVSNLVSRRFTRISTPLVQIALGIAIALIPFFDFDMTLDSELFLVLFIAPLLFEDAKKSDKPTLWRLKRPILLLALGLVFVTCLGVGAFVNWLIPAIPLAAAFALAAALAPTDAVAVGSLKDTASIAEEKQHLLQGEALFNDASSIVSFQFALAALAVGPYAFAAGQSELMFFGNVAVTFLIMFLGGVALGALLMAARYLMVRALRAGGIESITFHVLFELITPFLVFLIAEAVHVSGIIAVVTAGIAYSFTGRRQTPDNARHSIVSTSVWSVASFSLNGIVFLILGTQLPSLAMSILDGSEAEFWVLAPAIVAILAGILAIRFLWVLVMHRNKPLALYAARDADAAAAAQAEGGPLAAKAAPPAQEDGGPLAADAAQAAQAVGGSLAADAAQPGNAAETSREAQPQQASLAAQPASAGNPAKEEQTIDERAALRFERAEAMRGQAKAIVRERRSADAALRKAERSAERRTPGYAKAHLHDALLLSLTGVKGAITLALLLTIPLYLSDGSAFPERDLLLFLASGVIMLSLILANFVIPLVAPKEAEAIEPGEEFDALLEILRRVIHNLNEQMTEHNRTVTEMVIRQYNNRIEQAGRLHAVYDPEEEALRRRIIHWELDHTLELIDEGRVSFTVGTMYIYQLSRLLARVEHHGERRWMIRGIAHQIAHHFGDRRRYLREHPEAQKMDRRAMGFAIRELQRENYRLVLRRLDTLMAEPNAPISALNQVTNDLRRRLTRMGNAQPPLVMLSQHKTEGFEDSMLDVEAKALQYERDAIEYFRERGRISRETAHRLRDNVALMELDIEEQLE